MKTKRLKQIFTIFLIAVFVMTQFSVVFAEEAAKEDNSKAEVTEVKEEKAKEKKEEKKEEPKEEKQEAEKEEKKEDKAETEEPSEEKVNKSEPKEDAASDEMVSEPAEEKVEEPSAQEEPSSEQSVEEEKTATEPSSKEESKAQESSSVSASKSLQSDSPKVLTVDVDNTTTLADGIYVPDQFDFEGGTGKAYFTCEKVIVEGGLATAVFVASSANMTHAYTGEAPSTEETKALYDPDTNSCGEGVYPVKDNKVTIPVVLNQTGKVASRTTAMSTPHWVNYTYKITVSDSSQTVDGDTSLKSGTYLADSVDVSGGTGKMQFAIDKIIVSGGEAKAVLRAIDKDKVTHFYLGTVSSDSDSANKALFDPDTRKTGNGVYATEYDSSANKGCYAEIPVKLNEEFSVAIRTEQMSTPHWVNYSIKININEADPRNYDNSGEHESAGVTYDILHPEEQGGEDPSGGGSSDDPAPDPSGSTKLADGTYTIKATTDRKMFYLYPSDTDPATVTLVVKKGVMTATITLNGNGYDYVYMGTPAQAKAAGSSKWIPAKIVNGYYTFTIPVKALDTKLAITPRSSRYASDPKMADQAWRPDKWILFYGNTAKKTSDGSSVVPDKPKKKEDSYATSGTQKKFKNDKKKDKVSKSKDDRSASTHAVNNSTTLKDGVYTPDAFHWSGGSGRLAFIRCDKITVSGGKAYATIVFGSSKYDSLRANGRVYSRSGGGNSTFVIPVKLNANNTIVGRTTAMSSPHWIKYTIYIKKAESKKEAQAAKKAEEQAAQAKNKLMDKAPEILGLKAKDAVEVKYSELFRIYHYDQGVSLLSIDITKYSELYEEYSKNAKKASQNAGEELEYDDEGNIIARSQGEITEGLYQYNIINYLLVPEKFEVPAGLDKQYIIVKVPSESSYLASAEGLSVLEKLDQLGRVRFVGTDETQKRSKKVTKAIDKEKITDIGTYEKPNYREIVKNKADLTILPASSIPEEIKKDKKGNKPEDKVAEAEELKTILETSESRMTALGVPVIIDRSTSEKKELAQKEWIKVYGVLYGCEEEAQKAFDKEVKAAKSQKKS